MSQGQAQECILEKSMADNRKSTITAKVAAQIVEYYRLAGTNLDASNATIIVGSRRYREWKKRLELKSHYHNCVMFLYMGMQAEEQQKWGERVTWFSTALERLNESIKLSKVRFHYKLPLKYFFSLIGECLESNFVLT